MIFIYLDVFNRIINYIGDGFFNFGFIFSIKIEYIFNYMEMNVLVFIFFNKKKGKKIFEGKNIK